MINRDLIFKENKMSFLGRKSDNAHVEVELPSAAENESSGDESQRQEVSGGNNEESPRIPTPREGIPRGQIKLHAKFADYDMV